MRRERLESCMESMRYPVRRVAWLAAFLVALPLSARAQVPTAAAPQIWGAPEIVEVQAEPGPAVWREQRRPERYLARITAAAPLSHAVAPPQGTQCCAIAPARRKRHHRPAPAGEQYARGDRP